MDVTKLFKKVGGRGSGRGGGDGRGRGRGTPRGRGRGRGSSSTKKPINVIDLDDDDELCNQALERAELDNNSLTRSFEALNAASELDGFDPLTGCIWIYPTNRPVRDYQYEIVKTALFNNTLVSLPTGLGKTFISAVVMYNFQRWYPTGIIVFMAPTRPLVTQQLDACHNTVGISPAKTVELTGQIAPKRRQQLWKDKCVFFLTPQVMLSDLERNFFPPENVRCIVVDEAHKALGNHAYVQVISKISEKNRLFRVLALSATPGSDIVAVKQVFKNLLISRVELRSEDSLDILPYIHEKKVDKIVVKLDDYLKDVHRQLMEVFQIYSGKLMKASALSGRDGISYSKFQLLKARETFRKDMAHKIPNYQKGYIEVDYAICISLAHADEILLSHGLRTFYIFLHGVISKEKGTPAVTAELKKNVCIQNLLTDIQQKLNISAENSTFDFDLSTSALFSTVGSPKQNLPNRSFIQDDIDFTLSHPKLKVLRDVVHKHFLDYQYKNATTRVMIFSQYRDSVQEIGNMLNSLRPMVKPMVFIGQANTSSVGRGLKQKDQVQVVQQFRDGGFNVLVSTSVGEEGLDIGEVDLIICFDASKSPTRLIQRMGRTGRQREGRTVFLLTEGKEERCYSASFSLHSSISKSITDPNKLQPFLYKQSPRMVPVGIDPVCYKMSIILSTEQSSQLEPIRLDNDDDNSNEEPSKAALQKTKKKANAGKKKKNDTGKATSTKSIATLFGQMSKPPSQNGAQQNQNTDVGPQRDHPAYVYRNDDIDDYCVDEGMHIFAENESKAFSKLSAYPKIFDTDRPDRLEWKPCTTFVKKKLPPSTAVGTSTLIKQLDCLLLDDKELASVEFGVKSRESFSYLKTDYCGCGNTMEPHEAERDTKCYAVPNVPFVPAIHEDPGVVDDPFALDDPFVLDDDHVVPNDPIVPDVPKDSIILDEPFIDEDFLDEIPPELLEDFDSQPFPDVSEDNPMLTPPPKKKSPDIFLKTPVNEVSSDEDMRSEFSASPEICQNRFMEKLKEIKAAKQAPSNVPAVSAPSIPDDDKQVSLPCANDNEDPMELTSSVQSFSKKKFKFKKKETFTNQPKFEEQDQNAQMSPSPPLSPILKLPSVRNDLFKSPQAPPSPHYQFEDILDIFDEDKCEDYLPEKIAPRNSCATSSSTATSSTSSKLVKKPVKFLKPPIGPRRLSDVRPDDIAEESFNKTLEYSPASNLKAVGTTVIRKTPTSKSIGGFHTTNLQQPTFEGSSIAKGKQEVSRHRQSLKVVQPSVWKYSSNDVSVTEMQQERRPIVKTYQSPSSAAHIPATKVVPVPTSKMEPENTNTSARPKFSKSPSVSSSSIVSSIAGNTRVRPERNLLSRNRPRKHVTAASTSSSITGSIKPPPKFNFNAIAPPLTPPRTSKPNHSDSDDSDSPEICFERRKTSTPRTPFQAAGLGRSSFNPGKTTPKTPVSSRRSQNPNRLRMAEAAVSISRSVTKSPITPTQLRYSRSRESSVYSSPQASASHVSAVSSENSPFVIERRNLAKRTRRKANPFVECEAEVSGDDSDGTFGDENEFEYEGLDDIDDSFVTQEDDHGVTDSQHGMYLESVKDAIPARFGRIEKPLSPKNYGNDMDTTAESYEDDSFCQEGDDVEYMDVGVFTQAMNQARVELATSNSGRQTRRGKREAIAAKPSGSRQPKQRRRIVTLDDSSDDDDDFQ